MATGTDATGTDAYAEVLAAPSGNTRYRRISASCDTKNAIISLDAGTTDFAEIIAGEPALVFDMSHAPVTLAIQGKNGTAGQDYANLVINAW